MNRKLIFVLKALGLAVILFVALFPLFWMFITSGKTMTELLEIPSRLEILRMLSALIVMQTNSRIMQKMVAVTLISRFLCDFLC